MFKVILSIMIHFDVQISVSAFRTSNFGLFEWISFSGCAGKRRKDSKRKMHAVSFDFAPSPDLAIRFRIEFPASVVWGPFAARV